jgi:hypothetical protein
MLLRLLGLILLAMAALAFWYVRPREDGKYRYPPHYRVWVERILPLALIFIVALGTMLAIFGTINPARLLLGIKAGIA